MASDAETETSEPRIGGYAIVRHGGDELSDWESVAALAATKADALSLAKTQIGAFSLTEAFAERKRLNEEAGYEMHRNDTGEWASIHALSPELYEEFTKVVSADKDGLQRSQLASTILEDFQHARYTVGQETVLCTEDEAEEIYFARHPPAGHNL